MNTAKNSMYELQVKLPTSADFTTLFTGSNYATANDAMKTLIKTSEVKLKKSNFRIVKIGTHITG